MNNNNNNNNNNHNNNHNNSNNSNNNNNNNNDKVFRRIQKTQCAYFTTQKNKLVKTYKIFLITVTYK